MRDSARIVSIPRTSHARLLVPRTAIGLTNSSQLCLPLRCRCRYQLPTSTLSAPSPISHLQAPTVLARSLHGKLDLVIQTSPPRLLVHRLHLARPPSLRHRLQGEERERAPCFLSVRIPSRLSFLTETVPA